MRGLIALGFLAGCELVFPLDDTGSGTEICAGNSTVALLDGCFTSPRAELMVGPMIDTDSDDCDSVIVQDDVDGPELCAIGADRVVVGNTRVIGSRPLLLGARDELEIAGSLSVASRIGRETGAGGNFLGCKTVGLDGDDGASMAGGGGAGGSFGSTGETGGFAGNGANTGGSPSFDPSPLTFIRGGCPGGRGGNAGVVPVVMGGVGGDGGGAMYLIAGTRITLGGLLDASGSGGEHGDSGMVGGGAGGGGAGGLIALDAPTVLLRAQSKLIANGGGGGGGGTANGNVASDGNSPDDTQAPFIGTGGEAEGGGRGGDGATVDTAAVNGNSTSEPGGAGGGAGGGFGHIFVFGTLEDEGGLFSPAIEP